MQIARRVSHSLHFSLLHALPNITPDLQAKVLSKTYEIAREFDIISNLEIESSSSPHFFLTHFNVPKALGTLRSF